jgi:hypothetical protein
MAKNKWSQPTNPPPPLFTGEKERNLVKQINDEVIERVIGQTVLYYPISLDKTNFHSLYGEAIEMTINVYFHKRRLTEDQNLFVREGDFVLYGDFHYEIVTLNEPKQLFGQVDYKYEIAATCKRARRGTFNAL